MTTTKFVILKIYFTEENDRGYSGKSKLNYIKNCK